MKLLRNIPNGIKLFRSVSIFNYYLKDLEALRASGQGEKERELIAYATGLWVDKVIDIFDLTVNVSGKENIPADGPCVFIANHQGYADIVVLFKAAEGRQIGFIAKDSLQKVPYFGKWIQAIRGVFIKRGDAREALKSIQDGVQTLKVLLWDTLKPVALNWLPRQKFQLYQLRLTVRAICSKIGA